jgi:hypothetical protein
MRSLVALTALAVLAFALCGPAQAGAYCSLGAGTANMDADLTVSSSTMPVNTLSDTYHPLAADAKIGMMVGNNLAVYGTAKACDFKVAGDSRVYSGMVGVGASLFLQGDGKGLYVTAAQGRSLWYQKDLQDRAFDGDATAVGVGLFLGKNLSIEATCINGETDGNLGESDLHFTTNTKTYMGTVNVRF